MDLMDYRRKIIANSPHLMSASGAVVSFSDGADLPLKSLIVNIDPVQSGTGDPSPDNVRPISGWNGVKVTRTGKNLLNPHVYTGIAYNPTVGNTVTLTDSATQFTDNGNGVFTVTTSATWRYFNIIIPIDPTKEYATKISFSSTGQAGVTRGYLDADFKILTKFNSTDSAISWEYSNIPEANAAYYYFVFTNRGTASATLTLTQPQIVEGATVGDYEPYNGLEVAIVFGQTVYGGTLNPLTGILTAYPYYASYNGETLAGEWISDRDKYVQGTTPTIGAQVVDMSGTGTEVQLTPHQIRSLYGNNTIFADTGNVALEYWAHP